MIHSRRAVMSALQPLVRHRCIDSYTAANGSELIQEPVLRRAEAAKQRNEWGFGRVGEEGLATLANQHIRVAVAKL